MKYGMKKKRHLIQPLIAIFMLIPLFYLFFASFFQTIMTVVSPISTSPNSIRSNYFGEHIHVICAFDLY